ncbi:MAG: type II toxin-antitoxin system HicA family toxin [Saprospiraceae bacterium]|uniref:Type II toxin-antitoxin system HicA family toxin n=1 Tax=Candidatus Defluviibacterium haderslevense TaxID=2981993 RepID=A0A9D7SC20_9BACT|nr:type II toxin-antitoxin system HicA family toxin [Candidatus Defluviibacterium haderslevense]MBL0235711.1 type II toxin-antitoxin system HicA family toxin [Candidatus Defluviibacterium haderslevense]
MSKLQKILDWIINSSGTIIYSELSYVLSKFGYLEIKTGKTSGSRVAFYNKSKKLLIRLHKPHPGNELKDYQVKLIRSHLEQNKLL